MKIAPTHSKLNLQLSHAFCHIHGYYVITFNMARGTYVMIIKFQNFENDLLCGSILHK